MDKDIHLLDYFVSQLTESSREMWEDLCRQGALHDKAALIRLIVEYAVKHYGYPRSEAEFFAELFIDGAFSGLDPQLEAVKQMGYPRCVPEA